MLECKECNKAISPLATVCPNCGSKNQFKGYRFSRKELKAMGVETTMQFYNWQSRGGKIGSGFFGKVVKVALWTLFAIGMIFFMNDDIKQAEKQHQQMEMIKGK